MIVPIIATYFRVVSRVLAIVLSTYVGRLGLHARFSHLRREHEFQSRAIVGEQPALFDSVLGGLLSCLRANGFLESFVCSCHHWPHR
jgi:hypothetical protein